MTTYDEWKTRDTQGDNALSKDLAFSGDHDDELMLAKADYDYYAIMAAEPFDFSTCIDQCNRHFCRECSCFHDGEHIEFNLMLNIGGWCAIHSTHHKPDSPLNGFRQTELWLEQEDFKRDICNHSYELCIVNGEPSTYCPKCDKFSA